MIRQSFLATIILSIFLSGCAGHKATMHEWWECALAGGAVGGVGGAMENSKTAAYGAVGGAIIGGAICALTHEKPQPSKTVEVAIPKDSDGDGVPDSLDKCPGTPPGTRVGAEGCPIIPAVQKDPIPVMEPVLFDSSSASLSAKAKGILDEGVEYLRAHPKAVIQLKGHADSSGPKAFNQEISEKRVHAVQSYLINSGVQHTHIFIEASGIDEPAVSNTTKDGRRQNRRVEAKIFENNGS
ncbi:OmpA family protein [Parendozoicomonas sp. Alg238-R29]|uniref:OmpA family protein n=1 Tax=Parendozoicomonas sp. Alg238-R29 TaxID=2993446 RepID=UPI00248EB752|nr:OmpA family protein [Parendozoicomonas sp. Alg238-R29]